MCTKYAPPLWSTTQKSGTICFHFSAKNLLDPKMFEDENSPLKGGVWSTPDIVHQHWRIPPLKGRAVTKHNFVIVRRQSASKK